MQLAFNEFIDEQKKGLAELLATWQVRVVAARNAARESAARIKELNRRCGPGRSGVRLTTVSQGAAQGLIELHADIVNDALTEAAAQIERMPTRKASATGAHAGRGLQADTPAHRRRHARAVTILKDAAGDARKAIAPREAAAKTAAKKRTGASHGQGQSQNQSQDQS